MITIIGSGAFGTSLAISLASKNSPVTLIARDLQTADNLNRDRENTKYLPNAPFPNFLSSSHITESINANSTVLLAVPMQQIRSAILHHQQFLGSKTVVACCKGIELSTGDGPVKILEDLLPKSTPAMLTGPSFARDIASGLPTALTLACGDDSVGKSLQQSLTTANLRIYRTTDTIGAQIGGALKNVMAIACGAAMGAGLGESARAALMTRGFAEMQRLAISIGARPETLSGLSGFGDLTLTCTSQQSRNYRFGLTLGEGRQFDSTITVEGVATARAVRDWTKNLGFEMPITETVVDLLDGKIQIEQAMHALLSRPLKEE